MKVGFRIAQPDDASLIAEIGSEAFTAAFGPHNTPENLRQHLESNFTTSVVKSEFDNRSQYLIAEVDSHATGFGKWKVHAGPDFVPGINPVEIQQLYLLPKFRRLKIGTRLIDELTNLARKENADGLFLGVWKQANWAIRFYENCGFEPVGEQIFRVGQDDQVDWLMYKALA